MSNNSIRRKTLEAWIDEAITDPDKDGKCTMISLVHMIGMQEKEIHTTKFGGGKAWTANDLGAMFHQKASAYCQDIPGIQTFQLIAFYGDRTTPQAFQPFTISVNRDANGLTTESPTEQGRLQMSMRNEQRVLDQVYRRQQTMDEHSIRLISQQTNIIQSLLSENRDAFNIVKDMLMAKALDEHNRTMDQLKFERQTIERKKMMGWVPALANTILGREIFPQSTADTSLVESIADSLNEDDIGRLAASLKPELWGPLAARMHAYMQKKNKEEADVKALSAMTKSPDPESDAAGDVIQLNGKS